MPTRVLDFDTVVLEAVAFFAVQPSTAPFLEAMPKSPGLYERLLRLSQPTTFFFLEAVLALFAVFAVVPAENCMLLC